jgi:hypothetical protein
LNIVGPPDETAAAARRFPTLFLWHPDRQRRILRRTSDFAARCTKKPWMSALQQVCGNGANSECDKYAEV